MEMMKCPLKDLIIILLARDHWIATLKVDKTVSLKHLVNQIATN